MLGTGINPRNNRTNYRVIEDYAGLLPVPSCSIKHPLEPDDSILFVRLSAIGDVVRLLPAVEYLRRNGFQGRLDWAVHPPMERLLQQWPGITRVYPVQRENWWHHPDRVLESLRSLRQTPYDWTFDFHGLLKSALVSVYSRAQRRVGFHRINCKEGNFLFQTTTVSGLPSSLPRILKYIQLLRPFTRSFPFQRHQLHPRVPDFQNLSSSVKQAGALQPVLIHPRTSHARYGRKKEWGRTRFRNFLRAVLPELQHPVRITWGPGERETAEAIAGGFDDRVRVAPRTRDLANLTHLIQHASILLSPDTAPCHIADMVGTPLVALFGSSDHFVSGPLLTNYRLITCRGNEQGTAGIPEGRVLRAFLDLYRDIN